MRCREELLFAISGARSGNSCMHEPHHVASAVPYTVLIAPDGNVLYREQGSVDILKLRRTILANLPSDYEGFNQYWSAP